MTTSSSPLVSIVIDNYNYAPFVGGAIASALAQTYSRTEVVVVDDGSTDESREVISSYRNQARCVLKANGGQASALNAGLQVSRGEVVIFLDSDDLLYPTAVERVVSSLGPDHSKAHFRLQVIDEQGKSGHRTAPARKFPLGSGAVLADVLRRGRYVSSPNSGNAFRRSVIDRLGPVPESFRAADTFYVYGAPFLGPICAIDEVLGAYRVHGSNKWDDSSAYGTPQIPHFGVPLDLARHQLIRDLAERYGLVIDGARFDFRDPNHLLARLASLRLEDGSTRASFDQSGVVGGDTALGLMGAALPVILSGDGGRAVRRAATATVLVALATAPRHRAGRIARWYFSPGSRSLGEGRVAEVMRRVARRGRSMTGPRFRRPIVSGQSELRP